MNVDESKRRGYGFTLLELLVTVAVVAMLAALLLPAVSGAKARAATTICLSNLRGLQTCWQLYVNDSNDSMPPNTSASVGGVWRSTTNSWIGSSNAVRDTDTSAIESGLLYRYDYNRSTAVYRCPADRSTVQDKSGASMSQLRVRSYSMSGSFGGRTNEVQTVFRTMNEVAEPSRMFVFIDEHESSIDDAHFLTWPSPDDRWVNLPTDRHGLAGTLSFSDGHSELWRWRWTKRFSGRKMYWKRAECSADLVDLRRLQEAVPSPPVGWKPQD